MASIRDLGKYFAVVSWASGLVVVLVPLSLVMAGAPGGRPDFLALRRAAGSLDLEGFGFLVAVVALVGVLVQPLQYGFTQLLEGYWGPSAPALRAMNRSSSVHLRRVLSARTEKAFRTAEYAELHDAVDRFRKFKQDRLTYSPGSGGFMASAGFEDALLARELKLYEPALRERLRVDEMERFLSRYPEDPLDIMPTRLGNMLRRYERIAGRAFGHDLNASVLIAQVAEPTLRDYYDDARTDLDVSVRMALSWLLSAVVSTALTWRYDVWLTVPVACYVLAWISYRGSIGAAASFGDALITLVMLGRFDLYQALNLPLPKTEEGERWLAFMIQRQFEGFPTEATYESGRPLGVDDGDDRGNRSGYL